MANEPQNSTTASNMQAMLAAGNFKRPDMGAAPSPVNAGGKVNIAHFLKPDHIPEAANLAGVCVMNHDIAESRTRLQTSSVHAAANTNTQPGLHNGKSRESVHR